MTISGLHFEVAYWPAMTLVSAAQVAAAHCPNERTLDPAVCSYNRPIIKTAATSCHILRLKWTKFDFGWGSAPDPAQGAYSAPQSSPRPPGFKGASSKCGPHDFESENSPRVPDCSCSFR